MVRHDISLTFSDHGVVTVYRIVRSLEGRWRIQADSEADGKYVLPLAFATPAEALWHCLNGVRHEQPAVRPMLAA